MTLKPLKSQRIEAEKKRVLFHKFEDKCGVGSNAQLRGEFNDIQDCITNGWPLPERYYRLGVDKTRDRLLEETGVNHLHLGGRGSDILLYLIQTKETVILLRIDTHAHLEDEPRGEALLRALRLSWLRA